MGLFVVCVTSRPSRSTVVDGFHRESFDEMLWTLCENACFIEDEESTGFRFPRRLERIHRERFIRCDFYLCPHCTRSVLWWDVVGFFIWNFVVEKHTSGKRRKTALVTSSSGSQKYAPGNVANLLWTPSSQNSLLLDQPSQVCPRSLRIIRGIHSDDCWIRPRYWSTSTWLVTLYWNCYWRSIG